MPWTDQCRHTLGTPHHWKLSLSPEGSFLQLFAARSELLLLSEGFSTSVRHSSPPHLHHCPSLPEIGHLWWWQKPVRFGYRNEIPSWNSVRARTGLTPHPTGQPKSWDWSRLWVGHQSFPKQDSTGTQQESWVFIFILWYKLTSAAENIFPCTPSFIFINGFALMNLWGQVNGMSVLHHCNIFFNLFLSFLSKS